MGSPDQPRASADDRTALGGRLAALRSAAGYTQETFAALAYYGRSSIANIETGRQSAPRAFWVRCDELFGTSGLLTAEHDRLTSRHREEQIEGLREDYALGGGIPTQSREIAWAAAVGEVGRVERPQRRDLLRIPAGRYFAEAELPVQVFPATNDGRVLTRLPPGYLEDPFIARNRRGLVVAAVDSADGQQLYGLDTRHVRRKLSGQVGGNRLLVPRAYLLDEVTTGLIWAVTGFDDALLHDDRALSDYARWARQSTLQAGAAGATAVAAPAPSDLAAPSMMWLGSDFCARHILRHINLFPETPVFWTREQRGEEASAWLFFAHKYAYLEQLAQRFPDGTTRSFCVPETAVTASTMTERILLLLAAALMESFSIHILLTGEPEYSAVDGFVLGSARRAIVANWIGIDSLWFADVTTTAPAVREYADAHGYAKTHSTIHADTPAARLRTLATYLRVDWATISRRCSELASYGLAGIAEPRSRWLSLAGAERACRYLGGLARQGRL